MSFAPWIIWPLWLGMFAVFELIALRSKRKGDTLSEATQFTFATKTFIGRIIFGVVWVLFATWFLYHIIWSN